MAQRKIADDEPRTVNRPTDPSTTPDVSAGWEAEYTAQDVSADPLEERPPDCECWDPAADLPCWACFLAGFDEPNPDAPAESPGGGSA